jgi:hypothetical protein
MRINVVDTVGLRPVEGIAQSDELSVAARQCVHHARNLSARLRAINIKY